MTALRVIYEVARRDLVQRARSRIFLGATLGIALLILGVGPLLSNVIADQGLISVGVVGDVSPELVAALQSNAAVLEVEYTVEPFPDRSAGEDALRGPGIDVLIDGGTVVWEERIGPITNALVAGAVQEVNRIEATASLGVPEERLAELLGPPDFVILDEPEPEAGARQAAAYTGAVMLFMSMVIFGQFVLLGVLEEKANRVAEVVLSRVRPTQLLAGKVIGIGILGLVQLLILGGSVVVTVGAIDVADLPDLGSIGLGVMATVVAWYFLGYGFYSVLYAAAGSLVSRQEDVQGVAWIPMSGLLPGYMIGLFATWNPDALIVRIGSMLPGTAPLVMPVRASAGEVAGWELAVAIVVTVLSTYLLIRFAARVYRGGILQGGRIRLRDAWRAAEG